MLQVLRYPRLALAHEPGQTMNLTLDLPPVKSLDFSIGFDSDAPSPGDTVEFHLTWGMGSGEIRFVKPFDLKADGDRWHPFRLDISALSGGHARVQMKMTWRGSVRSAPRGAGWSGLDLAIDDCRGRRIDGGYEVDVGPETEFIKLRLQSDSREVPLEIGLKDDLERIRWVSFPSHMPARDVIVDVRERDTDKIEVRSDSAFSLETARVVHIGEGYPDYQLIWDTDMYIYESFSAVEKGVCIDSRAVDFLEGDGRRVLALSHLSEVGGVECGHSVIRAYEPERVLLDVSAERDCFLLFQDSYYPGWRARIDGNETRILPTDIGMRAIELSEGNHTVEMVFRPGSLKLGALLTCLGAVLTALYAWKLRPRNN